MVCLPEKSTGDDTRVQSPWIAFAIGVAAIIAVVAVAMSLWRAVGQSEISPAGWLAMGLGIVATLAVGIGLMALVFISNRRGYDDEGGGRGR